MSERDRILGILKAGPRGRSAGQWSAMVRQLTSAIDDRERTIAGILQLEEALADLWRILAMLSPAADVHKILVVLDERPASPKRRHVS